MAEEFNGRRNSTNYKRLTAELVDEIIRAFMTQKDNSYKTLAEQFGVGVYDISKAVDYFFLKKRC